jgi:hypothetical protein
VFAHSRFVENPPIWSWETNPSFLRWFCHKDNPRIWANWDSFTWNLLPLVIHIKILSFFVIKESGVELCDDLLVLVVAELQQIGNAMKITSF